MAEQFTHCWLLVPLPLRRDCHRRRQPRVGEMVNGMRYTLSFEFLNNFKIPIEVGASFAIQDALIFITAIDDEAKRVEYVATEAKG